MTLYERIGQTYSATRRQDPRLAQCIWSELAECRSVLNVGAGTGSYEPSDRFVVAVEPSATMVRQRPRTAAPAVRAQAEALPFRDRSFDAAIAIFTIHHWADLDAGILELQRVTTKTVVVLSWDPRVWDQFWLNREYFPSVGDLDAPRGVVVSDLAAKFGDADVVPLLVPHDCVDGFHGAFWRRPEAYLDPVVRAGISGFALMAPSVLERGLGRLAADLDSGLWASRHGDLLERDELDLGYRLIVARQR